MTRAHTPSIQELDSLHTQVRNVLALLFVLTSCLVSYMAIRIFVLSDRITFLEFASLCSFALACAVLSGVQLHCTHLVRGDSEHGIGRMVLTDGLTGLSNYRCLKKSLDEAFERASRHGSPLAIVYIDLDRFKRINDTFGHDAGNVALKAVARRIDKWRRRQDVAARVGGDEFAILMPNLDHEGVMTAVERLREDLRSLARTARAGAPLESLTCSVGVASYPATARTQAGLLRAADEAMYRAKQAGRDCVAT